MSKFCTQNLRDNLNIKFCYISIEVATIVFITKLLRKDNIKTDIKSYLFLKNLFFTKIISLFNWLQYFPNTI